MFAFTDRERARLSEFRAITTDAQGREILVGLTLEETAFYMAHVRAAVTGQPDRAGKKKYVELNKKHERARLQVLGAEIELRNDKPTRQ